MTSSPPVIHWFRRDLRLTDNPSLLAAAATGCPVIPLYITSTWKKNHRWTGPRRQDFLCGCLRSLDANLQATGSRLIIRAGPATEALHRLILESGARAVHFNRDIDPFGKAVESAVLKLCADLGIACHAHDDAVLLPPGSVLSQQGTPYRVFTPFFKNWLTLAKPAPVGKPAPFTTPGSLASLPLPDLTWWDLPAPAPSPDPVAPGEKAARQRMTTALADAIPGYAARRDIPAGHTTSRLSQDLRFGLLSIRELHQRVLTNMRAATDAAARRSHEVFIQELAWREFYVQILHHFPHVLDQEFNLDHRGLEWDQDPGKLELWKNGLTGFPIVDAGMRQLAATGFMHNRIRMIVSMFLTKDLHLDWRLGEAHFMRHLIDGEIASNNGGWQWSAGTGADAAPYFRIQNPWTQTKRHDPEGAYIKTWLPELKNVPPAAFQAPPSNNRQLAPSYPFPILDHSTERDETLRRFKVLQS